jgi:hypothetical protein
MRILHRLSTKEREALGGVARVMSGSPRRHRLLMAVQQKKVKMQNANLKAACAGAAQRM